MKFRHCLFGLLLTFCLSESVAQRTSSNLEFESLRNAMNNYFAENPQGYKVWKRQEWFLEQRLYGEKTMVNIPMKTIAAYEEFKRNENSRTTHGFWNFIGPTNSATGIGRVNSIAIHPTNSAIIYVGTASGGVWKSTDSGTTWTNKTSRMPYLHISDVIISPNNSNTIFVLTGDGDPIPAVGTPHTTAEYASIGVIKSIDGGDTWYPTNLMYSHDGTGLVPNKLIIHPTNENIQYLAHDNGIFKTIDQWNTYDTLITGIVYDLEFKINNPEIIFASRNNMIMRSLDGGATFDTITDNSFMSMSSCTRVDIAVTPENPEVIGAAGGSSLLVGVYLSLTGGASDSWTEQASNISLSGGQAFYNMNMAFDPTNWSIQYVGMVKMLKSTDSGGTWTLINDSNLHSDVHDLVIKNNIIYVACDGGIYKSTNQGSTWQSIFSGLGIMEFYRIDGSTSNPNLFICGAQDNGTQKKSTTSTTFQRVNHSDGMDCAIDQTNPQYMYSSTQGGNFYRSFDGGNNFFPISIPSSTSAWLTPMAIDKGDPSMMFVGKDTLIRIENYGVNPVLVGFTGLDINCLEQCASLRSRLYYSSGAEIFYTNKALTTDFNGFNYNPINNGLPENFITDIEVHPGNANEVYITMSGFDAGNKVFKTTNAGTTWQNISGSLPNIPVNIIKYHDNGQTNNPLYIGTDIGVFYRNDDIGDWIFFSNELPTCIVNDLYINTVENTITAGTWGRGLWKSDLFDSCPEDLILAGQFAGRRQLSAANTIVATITNQIDMGNSLHLGAGNFIRLDPGFEVKPLAEFNARINDCPQPFTGLMGAPDPLVGTLIFSQKQLQWLLE